MAYYYESQDISRCPPPSFPPCPQPCYPPCPPPQPCCCCCCGTPGRDGKSAYEIALDNGFVGTEAQWLQSLVGPQGEPGPFLSSFLEAVGSTQSLSTIAPIRFGHEDDAVDIAGSAVSINEAGTVITINQAGLYRVEWSVNYTTTSAAPNVIIGLIENGEASSAMTSNAESGIHSGGGLIHVTEADVPYTVSLYNFGDPIEITNAAGAENTAVSIRITRFADGAV